MIRVGAALVAFVVGSVAVLWGARTTAPAPATAPAPESAAEIVAAGMSAPTTALLMAFIDTSDSTVNRSQALLIRNVRDQYEERGIRVLVVQAAGEQSEDERRNVRYDWGLDTLTILPDPEGRLARAYSVTEFPTTVVLNDLGEPLAAWSGYSPPAIVGPTLERIAGPE